MDLFKGYVRTKDKKCIEKFKDRTDFKKYDEVSSLDEYAGILANDVVLVDFDDAELAETMMKIVEENQMNCRVYETTRGKHFLFKNTKGYFDKCYTHKKTAIGLECDIKVGKNNSYEVLKINGKERFIEWDVEEGEDYQEVPKWLSIVNSKFEFMNLEEGDGRNQELFNYILTLQSNDFTKEEAIECIKIINKYVLKQPLSDEELAVVLRDDSFKKPVFFSKNTFLHDKFGNYLKNEHHIIKINGQLHIYMDGVYVPGYTNIESLMVKHISNLKASQRKEVLNYLELTVPEHDNVADSNYISFKNGVYDIANDALLPNSPNLIVTNKINWNYKKDSYSELADKTLNKLACDDVNIRALLEECIGYCFYKRNELGKAFMLTGEKSNGKSTYLDIVKYLLGEGNVSSLDLKELGDRFSTAMMYGKLANIGDDIGDDFIQNTSYFKKIVTGNRIKAERKGQDPFEFNPYVKMMFSCNSIPRMGKGKDSGAVLRRMIIIPFNARFSPDDPDFDAFVKYKLQKPESIEYLIQIGILGLRRVLANQAFTKSTKVDKEVKEYEIENNPILLFFNEVDEDEIVNEPTNEVFLRYKAFCDDAGMQSISNVSFSKIVCKQYGFEIDNKKINGQKRRIFVKGDAE